MRKVRNLILGLMLTLAVIPAIYALARQWSLGKQSAMA